MQMEVEKVSKLTQSDDFIRRKSQKSVGTASYLSRNVKDLSAEGTSTLIRN